MIGFNIEAIVMKSFVPEMLVVTFLSLTIGFCEEGMFRFYIYLATKNFAIIALWHAYIDFNLFITKFGSFPITHKISIVLDVLIRIIFVMCLICLGIKIYKNYRRKKVGKNF